MEGDMATPAERVVKLLSDLGGDGLCDACIAQKVGFRKRGQANQIANVLALTRDYSRGTGSCMECGKVKMVTARA